MPLNVRSWWSWCFPKRSTILVGEVGEEQCRRPAGISAHWPVYASTLICGHQLCLLTQRPLLLVQVVEIRVAGTREIRVRTRVTVSRRDLEQSCSFLILREAS